MADGGRVPVSGMGVVIGGLCLHPVVPAAKATVRKNIAIKFAFFIFRYG
jgi:hypothetical protein